MRRVCHITSAHPALDDRIFHKECKSLCKAGYEVVLIGMHERDETIDGIRIRALTRPKTRLMRMVGHSFIILGVALKQKADIYHFHDPELLPVGLILRFLKKKVIYDAHEDVPKQIMAKTYLGNIIARKIMASMVALMEKLGEVFFDRIIGATPDIVAKFRGDKCIAVRNMPILNLIDEVEPIHSAMKNKPILIYAGGLSKIRGIVELITAMEVVKGRAQLWLLGSWENTQFEQECRALAGWNYTKYLGYRPLSEVYSYMKIADIGISVLYPIKNYVTSLPVKAFEYMSCSLPMIASNFPYWENIFGECALFVDPYDPGDIADKIVMLLSNPLMAMKLGHRGRQLVDEKYNWEKESRLLIDIYEALV